MAERRHRRADQQRRREDAALPARLRPDALLTARTRWLAAGAAAVLVAGAAVALTRSRERAGRAELVAVRAGWFTMGDDRGLPDERPAHRVFVSAFRIDRVEVSVGRYERCVRAGACRPPGTAGSETRSDYFTRSRYRDYPVVGVTWQDAVAYCRWRHARLPTEAEWEKAARGSDGRLYPWGTRFAPGRLNYCDRRCHLPWRDAAHDDGSEDTTPVDAFPAGASPYGALNMAGNVWEWVSDRYGPTYYGRSPARDPTGPAGGTQRVTRGGGVFDDPVFTRATVRRRFVPTVASTSTGFRCARS